jgi:hypothetical protein
LFDWIKRAIWWLTLVLAAAIAALWEPARDFLKSTALVPVWLLIVAIAVCVPSLAWHVVRWRLSSRRPQFLALRQLEHVGVKWRWRYSYESPEPYDLAPYCPKCEGQIEVRSKSRRENEYRCGVCDFSTVISGVDTATLEYNVQLLVRQQIRKLGGDPDDVEPPQMKPRYF